MIRKKIILTTIILIVVLIVAGFLVSRKPMNFSVEQFFSGSFSSTQVSFRLPRGWSHLPEGWNTNDPIFAYALSGYVSPDSRKYNKGVVCPTPPTEGKSCNPHNPRYDLVIEELSHTHDSPYKYGDSKITSQKIGENTFLVYETDNRIVYSFLAEPANAMGDDDYYTFSFTSTTNDALRNSILATMKVNPRN